MYYNKLTSGFVSAIFLLLVISSVNFSSIKLINAATGDLVNYNNNFQMYTSPNDPNKDSAMQNADCVVNFMTSYVYTASSAENCNNSDSSNMGGSSSSSSSSPSMSPSTPSSQSQGFAPTDGPQTGVKDGSGVGVVRVVDTNSNAGNNLPTQSSSSLATNNSNPANTNTNNNVNVNVDDDNNDNDNNAKDNNNDNNNDNDNNAKDNNNDNNNDNDNNAKVYNENTVNKQDRKLLLTTCFERAYDNGNYLSTDEIVDCASNYNS